MSASSYTSADRLRDWITFALYGLCTALSWTFRQTVGRVIERCAYDDDAGDTREPDAQS